MIAILLKTYPKLSETFIAGEIAGLERAGLALRIVALERSADRADPAVRAGVDYVPQSGIEIARAHLKLALGAPRRYLAALAFARRVHGARWRAIALRAGWLAWRLARARIAHVHAHFASDPTDIAELASRFGSLSYSVSAHAKDIYLAAPESLSRKLAGARFTITCTEYNRDFLTRLTGRTVHRMYHGIEAPKFGAVRGECAVPLLLSVGRLREKKGFPTLIAACALLAARRIAFRCEIVGYGPDRDALAHRIAAAGLDGRVTLAGRLAHDAVIERYRQASVFVLPCQVAADGDRDGIPNVLLEAMASGVPVVTTAVSGIPEAVTDGVNGRVVPPEDPHALAEAIAALLANAFERARLGSAGRATVRERFDGDANLACLRGLIAELADGR